MLVVDASALVEWATATARGAVIGERIETDAGPLAAPYLLDIEVLHALRRLRRIGAIDNDQASLAIDLVGQLRLVRFPHWAFAHRIWELRDSVSAYDATYLALAETLEAPLLTCDARLARSRGHSVVVEQA